MAALLAALSSRGKCQIPLAPSLPLKSRELFCSFNLFMYSPILLSSYREIMALFESGVVAGERRDETAAREDIHA
jgi:hypothetical protein